MKKSFFYSILALRTASIITGCGGGGSGNSGESNGGSNPVVLKDENISSKIIDGYLAYATVCLDLDRDGECKKDIEPVSTSDKNGNCSLTLTVAQQKKFPDFWTAPVISYGGIDLDTRAQFTGKLVNLLEPNKTSLNLTPATTLIASMVKNGTKIDEAKKQVAKLLGIDTKLVEEDPVQLASKDPKLLKSVLKLQKSLELLSRTQTKQTTKEAMDNLYSALAKSMSNSNNISEALDKLNSNGLKIDKNAIDAAKYLVKTIDDIEKFDTPKELAYKADSVKSLLSGSISNFDTKKNNDEFIKFLNDRLSENYTRSYAEELLGKIDYYAGDYHSAEYNNTVQKVADALDSAGFKTKSPFSIDDEMEALKSFPDILKAYKVFLEEESIKALASTKDGLKLNLPLIDFYWYDNSINIEGIYTDTYEYGEYILANNKGTSKQYFYNPKEKKWEESDMSMHSGGSGFILINGKWEKDDLDKFKVENNEIIYNNGTHLKLVKEVDLSKDRDNILINNYLNILEKLTFDSGAKAYVATYIHAKDSVRLWQAYEIFKGSNTSSTSSEPVDSITWSSLEDFIVSDEDIYEFDGYQGGALKWRDSGKLYMTYSEGDRQNVGTWEVIKLENNQLAIMTHFYYEDTSYSSSNNGSVRNFVSIR